MNAGLDFALAQVRDRDLVIESLREQHKTLGDHAANMERLLEAAEAKLAEVEKERDKWSDHWEAEHQQLVDLRASMDRARELAETAITKRHPVLGKYNALTEIARLLSGDG